MGCPLYAFYEWASEARPWLEMFRRY
ncbi:uncharacterized protein FTOL_13945 [Fusarium torulosum]|uniref:Uncharacterized protein n=1 Tax=Fusarium torulosum TaxID=33205 RepID=A0AAE8MQC5_9HYPO|nr:uncharacterized protein FTOL_13945 [Fusarium torulosum]